ncbi:MAG: hypothetical protein Q8O37_16450 [Sulfuricellaceae bacterium]|nr:hypothetical protein [Sulfuricellaceae bacterium]
MSPANRYAEADRRRAILAALSLAPAYTLSHRALRATVEGVGCAVSLDLIRAEIAWLDEIGLLDMLELDHVRLTDRGLDIVLGRAQAPGVRRPEPGEL